MMNDKLEQDNIQTLSNLEFSRRKLLQALTACSFENRIRLYLSHITTTSTKETKEKNKNINIQKKKGYYFRVRTKTEGFYDENVEPIILYDEKLVSSEARRQNDFGLQPPDFYNNSGTQCGENNGFDQKNDFRFSHINQLSPIVKSEHTQSNQRTLSENKDNCMSKFPITKRLYRCSTCGKGFCRSTDFKIHVSSRHESVQRVGFNTKCQKKVRKRKGFCRLNDLHIDKIQNDSGPGSGINRLSSENNCQITVKGTGVKILKGGNKYHVTGKLFECLKCHKGFCRRDDLSSHKIQQHNNVQEKSEKKNNMLKTGKIFTCFRCGKGFCRRKDLTVHHQNTSNGNCDLTRKLVEGIKLNSVGTNNERVKISRVNIENEGLILSSVNNENASNTVLKLLTKDCCFSKKKYKSNMVNMWTQNLNYKCKVCCRNFKYKNFKRHLKIHNCEKPFQCTKCGKDFQKIGNFNIHIRVHTNIRPYGCPSCARRFRQLGQVQSHFKLHRNGKGIRCKKCGGLFGNTLWLKDHTCVEKHN